MASAISTKLDRPIAEFANQYRTKAYCMDKITLVNACKDIDNDKPQAFRGFLIKFQTHPDFVGMIDYADHVYGRGMRRLWQSDLAFRHKSN